MPWTKKKIEVSVPKPEVFSKEAQNPYEFGFQRGYIALLRQMGENVSSPKIAAYTSMGTHEETEEESKGYVDGYHKACDSLESFSCTRDR
jgi:hypothetical protein